MGEQVFQMIIAKDFRLPNLRYFKPMGPVSQTPAMKTENRAENGSCELTSKRSFMDRLLNARGGKRSDSVGQADLSMARIPSRGKLWF